MATGHIRVVGGAKFLGGREGHWLFKDLDLDIDPGELFCLLGPSGSGKSTLLRILAGLDDLTAGTVEITSRAGETLNCGLVFQEPLLLPWLNVHDNIGLGLRYKQNQSDRRQRRRRRGHRHDEVSDLAERLGIADLLDRFPSQISGGQAQRVALARTVVTRPQVLLLDEPFAALDPGTRASLQDWLLEVVAKLDLTTLFVTHDVDEAVRLGSRIGVLAGSGKGLSQTWDLASLHGTDGTLDDLSGSSPASIREELISHVADLSGIGAHATRSTHSTRSTGEAVTLLV